MVLVYAKKSGEGAPGVVMITSMGPDGKIMKNRILHTFPGHGYNRKGSWYN